jgi:hypothetical protein
MSSLWVILIPLVLLTVFFVLLILKGLKPVSHIPKEPFEKKIYEAVLQWLLTYVSGRYHLSLSEIDQSAKNRLSGAAAKAVKPLMNRQEVHIQLPDLKIKAGLVENLETSLAYQDIQSLI